MSQIKPVWSLAFRWVAWLLTISAVHGQPPQTATVHVEVFGAFGERVANPLLRLYSRDGQHEIAKPNQESTEIVGVPFGEYVLSGGSGTALGKREIIVNKKDVWVRLGLGLFVGNQNGSGGAITISGVIKPVPAKPDDWWVRVEGVFLHVSGESPVSSRGEFSTGLFPMGTYLIQVFEGPKLQDARTVEVDNQNTNRRLIIEVP